MQDPFGTTEATASAAYASVNAAVMAFFHHDVFALFEATLRLKSKFEFKV